MSALLSKRNNIDEEISRIIGRPALQGHIGEFIASRIFNIELEQSAVAKGIDGRFRDGPLKGKTVNVKIYGKREGFLDISTKNLADYYLVLTGPGSDPVSSRGKSRPMIISNAYLFDMKRLMPTLKQRGVKIGVATSVIKEQWNRAEIYPQNRCNTITLDETQRELLRLFTN